MGSDVRKSLIQPHRGWWRLIGVSTAVVFTAVLVAAPALAAGTIELDPSQGAVGDTFEISGQGYATSEQVQIRWDDRPLGGQVRTDADGTFTLTRTVPADSQPGEHTITAKGLQSGLTAEAIFTVTDSSVTTTTSSDTTTTAAAATTTTTAGATEGEDTTTTAATEEEVSVVVTEFSVQPAETTPGSQIEIEGLLTGKLAKVHLWLDDGRLGTPLKVEEDGSFQATRTIPDLTPGTYSLRLKTPNGQVLVTRIFRVLATTEDATTTTTLSEPGSASGLTPIGAASILGMLLVAAVVVWWMWRRPSDDEKAPRFRAGPK